MDILYTKAFDLNSLHTHIPYSTFQQASVDSPVGFPFNKVQYAIKSSVSMATILKSHILTQEGSVKKTLELELNIEVYM